MAAQNNSKEMYGLLSWFGISGISHLQPSPQESVFWKLDSLHNLDKIATSPNLGMQWPAKINAVKVPYFPCKSHKKKNKT